MGRRWFRFSEREDEGSLTVRMDRRQWVRVVCGKKKDKRHEGQERRKPPWRMKEHQSREDGGRIRKGNAWERTKRAVKMEYARCTRQRERWAGTEMVMKA